VTVPALAAKLVLAWKVAVMVWVPAVRVEVEKVATPLELSVPWPRGVVPSEKLTTPDGMPLAVVTVAVKVMFVPAVAGEPEVVTVVVVAAGVMADVVMTWETVPALAAKLVLAWKAAVMVWLPMASAVVEKVTIPLALSDPWPRGVVPSEKLTTPDGTPLAVVTVAVKVIFVPAAAGEPEVVTAVVVAAGVVAVAVMIWVRVAKLAAKLVLPWNAAMMVWVPGGRVAVEKVAVPLVLTVAWPRRTVPSEKVTVPEGVPLAAVTVAVKVMFVPAAAGEPELVSTVVVMAGPPVVVVMVRVPGVLVMV